MRRRGGRYELRQVIGSGGMGTVWRAWDRHLHRMVALKSPHPLAPDDPRADRLAREARLAASVSHPNLVDVYDVGQDEEGPFLVMQFVDAPSLAESDRSLDAAEILAMGAELARALDTLHRAGIVHRDVKPSNVLLPPGGAKLVDFGVALDVDGRNGFEPTASGVVLGTRGYLAPEVARGGSASPRSDVYGLAKVLTELLEDRAPVDPAVTAVLARATADEPDVRPDAATLAGVLGSAAVTEWPPPVATAAGSSRSDGPPTTAALRSPADESTMAAPAGLLPPAAGPASGPQSGSSAAPPVRPPGRSAATSGGLGLPRAVGGGVLVVVSTVVVALVAAAWAASRDDADSAATSRSTPSAPTVTTSVTLPATTTTTIDTTTASSVATTADPLGPAIGLDDREEVEAAALEVLFGLVGDTEDERKALERIAEKTAEAADAMTDGKEDKAEDKLREAARIAVRDLDGSARRRVLVQLQAWAGQFDVDLTDVGRRDD